MEQTKIKNPPFIELPVYIQVNNDGSSPQLLMKTKLKLNPYHIYFYYPGVINSEGEDVEITHVYVGGRYFYIAMTFEQFDNQWNYINKSISIEEPLY